MSPISPDKFFHAQTAAESDFCEGWKKMGKANCSSEEVLCKLSSSPKIVSGGVKMISWVKSSNLHSESENPSELLTTAQTRRTEGGKDIHLSYTVAATSGVLAVSPLDPPSCSLAATTAVGDDADSPPSTPEVGAEVIVSADEVELDEVVMEEEEETPVKLLEVPRGRVELSRRCSYEEMIHPEPCGPCSEGCYSVLSEEENPTSMEKCLVVLTQWALSLQEIYDDRQSSSLSPSSTKCLCDKADGLMRELKQVERCYYDVIEMHDRAAIDSDMLGIQACVVRDLAASVREMQNRLKSSVSIQISTPSPDVTNKAAYLVGEVCDVRQYVKDAVDSLIQLVFDLLNVTGCRRHEEEDIRLGVALLRTDDRTDGDNMEDEDDEEDEEDKENCRKRKQVKPRTPPTSPTSSPSKRARRGRTVSAPGKAENCALELLESKRKGVRNHGLLQFVLWREALKAEKDRIVIVGGETKSNKRRLSFN